MLDPEYLKHCADELENLFVELETTILEDIARRIVENKYHNTSTAMHQLNRAKALGLQYDDMKKKISEIMKVSEKKVAEIITQAAYGSVDKDNVIFKEAYEKGIIHKFNYDEAGLAKIILSGIESTNGEIKNICKTTAKTAKKLLSDSLDMTYLSVQSGAFSQQDAVKLTVDTIARQGISWIDYESGAHRRVDTTIRTALRSGVNQTACRCQDKNFEDMGGNLVEVTSHMGARPSHAQWQGKIYWRKEKYKNYQNFELATGYGKGDGLGGWNCRHSFFPYFEGLSSKSFEHYRMGENKERYELDQEQRYNERMIREWKRRSAVNKAGKVDNSKEARKVKEWEQRQRNLLKAHPELKRNYAREFIEKTHVPILTPEHKSAIVRREIKVKSGIKGRINMAPSDIDIFTVAFDDSHINKDRAHQVTKEEAISMIESAKFSTLTWKGRFENYYSSLGVVFYDCQKHSIRTAFKPDEFDEKVRTALEVYEKHYGK